MSKIIKQQDFDIDIILRMVEVAPTFIVAKDASFFKTGPDLASKF